MAVEELPLRVVFEEGFIANGLNSGFYKRWIEGLGLKSTDRVLDVGARGGTDARHIAPLVSKGSVTCLDIDGRWLDIARKRLHAYANVDFVEADACQWTSPGTFDVAVMHFILHVIPSDARLSALCHVGENLVDGGRLYIREPLEPGLTEDGLNALLTQAGFEHVGSDERGTRRFKGPWVSSVWRKPFLARA
jgi:SAM-dependent methyltransferase